MTIIAYLTICLPSPPLRRHCCLRVARRKTEKERAKARGEGEEGGVLTAFIVIVDLPVMADSKHPRNEESSAVPRGLPRVCCDLFRGRYLSALSSFFRPCILSCCIHGDTCTVVGCCRRTRWRWAVGWPWRLRVLFVRQVPGAGWRWSVCRCRRWLGFVLGGAAEASCCGAVGCDHWSVMLACARLAHAGFARCVRRLLGVRFQGSPPGHSGSAAGVRPGAWSLLSRLGLDRAPAGQSAGSRGGPGRCRGGGARGKGRRGGRPGPCLW
jgi:hypothetical protein